MRNAALVALVEGGHHLFLEQAVERVGIGGILRGRIVGRRAAVNQPAVGAVVAFRPPAVADAQVRHAVDGGFHAAGAARLERLARRVEPHVAALREEMRHVKVVVIDERDASAIHRIDGMAIDLLEMVLPPIVRRVRFAGKHNLDVPPRRGENANQTIGILENQLRALVRGEAPREPDRERARIQQRTGRHDLSGADVLLRPAVARALANEGEQKPLQ